MTQQYQIEQEIVVVDNHRAVPNMFWIVYIQMKMISAQHVTIYIEDMV